MERAKEIKCGNCGSENFSLVKYGKLTFGECKECRAMSLNYDDRASLTDEQMAVWEDCANAIFQKMFHDRLRAEYEA